ncbi:MULTISPECIES: hypothetical protein [unclassified Leeuwenhoekiella]|uniref:hypothetical protein n=1 Tax=unclassified Leeuwenhoekiella TaxID=2615029 RepID=UPI000C3EFF39|nr:MULTISPECIES: hypothetical protein [unclassified Leeuwenhoekiella]MAW97164.1 hypothetical protein [Leeuwenhoekiella sp.]MBA82750.1 hypothetical protein [Leeuwenhoekiella sp.]|tara:strand:- start:3631 stop:4887 length:1257 start_codon:yes stop_codon:yes gene_type:complete
MIKRILIVVLISFTVSGWAQEGNTSPYSFYGLGLSNFKGSVENQAMGGISILGDSIHTNFRNPAGFGALKLTNFAIAGSHTETSLTSDEGSGSTTSTTIDYLSLSFPVSRKLGVGFGLIPQTSVDYANIEVSDEQINQYSGRGGVNRAFLAAGLELFKGFRIGGEASYNFGSIRNEIIQADANQQYAVREIDRSDVSGFTYNLGLQYEQNLGRGYQLYTSATFQPETALTLENDRSLQSVDYSVIDRSVVRVIEAQDFRLADSEMIIPNTYSFGLGTGKRNVWFAGAQAEFAETSKSTNRSFALNNATYQDSYKYRLGGYFIPDYNSITSYFSRVTYRLGARYEESGLYIQNESIDEFGISFGLGLPLGRGFSNANLTFEYGQRGTNNAGLVKEDFFKVGLSLSLNPLRPWFVPNKYN